jgi:thioesterase domain-containing protein
MFCGRQTLMSSGLPILRAFGQTSSEVVLREPGERFLSAPRPIERYAREHWEFAWLSVAAYQKTHAGAKETQRRIHAQQRPDPDPDPGVPLAAAGWQRWTDFPDDALLAQIGSTHLRVEVWQRQEPPAVAVTFGGTVFNNEADWKANLRWFLPGKQDAYTTVVQTFAPAFAAQLKRRSEGMAPEWLERLELFSTGHSLGGGLAQQFAYSLPLESVKHVKQVYAFDPSPVTGFYSVCKALRDQNKRELKIDRIYERGEILAILRSLMSVIYKPSAQHPRIRGVRYAVFRAWNAIAAHSIIELAQKLDGVVRGAQ